VKLLSVGVLLVIDCTGSMEVIHRYLASSLSSIVSKFQDEGVPVQFSAIGFRDYPAKPETAFEIIDFDEGINSLESWLSIVRAEGGGSNHGESSMSAIVHGIDSVNWPDVKRKVVALFTDDGPHVPDFKVESWGDAREKLTSNSIEQIHLFTVNRKVERYDELDGHDYVVIRHTLAENGLDDMDVENLEESIRNFVKVSSSGNFGSSEIIVRDDGQFESNPFDVDDFDTGTSTPLVPSSKEVESADSDDDSDDDFFDMD
jgi:hypothetical protein